MRSRPAPGRRPPPSTVIVAGFATAVALFCMVSVQSLVGQTQIRQTEIADRIEQKRDALEALEVEVANLSALARVAQRAAQLGLVMPPSIAFLPAPDASMVASDLANVGVPSYVAPSPAARTQQSGTASSKGASPKPKPSAKASAKPSAKPSTGSPSGGR